MILTDHHNRLTLAAAPEPVALAIRQGLTLPNPVWVEAEKRGRYSAHLSPVLKFYHSSNGELSIPAACRHLASGARYEMDPLPTLAIAHRLKFHGELRLYQDLALYEVTRQRYGVIDLATGGGKTAIACAAIAQRGVPALVIVPTKKLAQQWHDAIEQWLGIPAKEQGKIYGGKCELAETVTVGIVNSLHKVASKIADAFGHLIYDECHHVVAPKNWAMLAKLRAMYRLGLSATPYRRDGLGPAITWALGPITTIPRVALVDAGAVLPAQIDQRPTSFVSDVDGSENYAGLIAELVADTQRNAEIAEAVARDSERGVVLVLSAQVIHAETLAMRCAGTPGTWVAVRHGQQSAVAARSNEALLSDAMIIVATMDLLGEGFDLPAAQTLHLTTPIKWSGRLLQAIGRVLRPAPGKTHGLIVDWCDWNVPVLAASARSRAKTYRELIG